MLKDSGKSVTSELMKNPIKNYKNAPPSDTSRSKVSLTHVSSLSKLYSIDKKADGMSSKHTI